MLSMHINYKEFDGFKIEQNSHLVLRLCTICSQVDNIISHRITRNVWCIYTDTWCSNNFKEKFARK